MRGLSRPAGLLLTGVTAVALAGCGAGTAERAAPVPHAASPAAATSSLDAPSPLAAKLLPAGAFGDGAVVTPIPADQLSEVAGMAGLLGGTLGGAQITPSACADAVRQLVAQVAAVRDAAGEVARGSGTWTAELLVTTDPQVDVATLLDAVVSGCSSATVTVPQRGTATVALATITPSGLSSALPAGASALAVTVTAQRTGGGSFTGSGLLGLVPAGNRLLLLGQASPTGAAPDHDAFAALLAQAEARAH